MTWVPLGRGSYRIVDRHHEWVIRCRMDGEYDAVLLQDKKQILEITFSGDSSPGVSLDRVQCFVDRHPIPRVMLTDWDWLLEGPDLDDGKSTV